MPTLALCFAGVGLNKPYAIVEGVAGWMTGPLALLADEAHNLTDVAGRLIAWREAVKDYRRFAI